jgi:hypothetical protein
MENRGICAQCYEKVVATSDGYCPSCTKPFRVAAVDEIEAGEVAFAKARKRPIGVFLLSILSLLTALLLITVGFLRHWTILVEGLVHLALAAGLFTGQNWARLTCLIGGAAGVGLRFYMYGPGAVMYFTVGFYAVYLIILMSSVDFFTVPRGKMTSTDDYRPWMNS